MTFSRPDIEALCCKIYNTRSQRCLCWKRGAETATAVAGLTHHSHMYLDRQCWRETSSPKYRVKTHQSTRVVQISFNVCRGLFIFLASRSNWSCVWFAIGMHALQCIAPPSHTIEDIFFIFATYLFDIPFYLYKIYGRPTFRPTCFRPILLG